MKKNKVLLTLAVAFGLVAGAAQAATPELLNASYDVARNFYKDFNPVFIADWKQKTGQDIRINQSHGGSTKQARAVIDGLEADIYSSNNPLDVNAISEKGRLLSADWAKKFPNNSSPSWSTILFVVRKGNPKGIKDWGDLARSGVSVVVPNPKTSGNGRYSYLAAWEWAKRKNGGDEKAARTFVTSLFKNVPVLDTGGRGATTTFAQRDIGDVLLTFENEVRLIKDELGPDKFDVVIPSLTVRADNPIAIVDKVASKKGTTKIAQAYINFHYSDKGQEIFANNDIRPINPAILKKYASRFPELNVFDVDQAFGSWNKAQSTHFADGGTFDQIFQGK
ncbi:sulfate ABC transporter substrate-binding protein [Stenotrophobium rhamnosiphilum]|uniref:Sulfate ABC transporter substrate-binding protein n=1 Tax=Stenotrophobium rhamnosiphilum TaxID=2029166 RepID=A0A2T5MJQ0_9GAMM|nr:sulfate ABC transporter substrate-binding protein [Stenotrophobium rhamnosiphilum]PTU32788.1 sulfate ABC transporter substrate-binding protein [Stenotrophobium rhamnosiphilum]